MRVARITMRVTDLLLRAQHEAVRSTQQHETHAHQVFVDSQCLNCETQTSLFG